MSNAAISDEFHRWTDGLFGGFLTSIVVDVLRMQDEGK